MKKTHKDVTNVTPENVVNPVAQVTDPETEVTETIVKVAPKSLLKSVVENETTTPDKELKKKSGIPKHPFYMDGCAIILSTFVDSLPSLFAKHFDAWISTTSDSSARDFALRVRDMTKDSEGNYFRVLWDECDFESDFEETEDKKKTGFSRLDGKTWVSYTRPLTPSDFIGRNNILSNAYNRIFAEDEEVRKVARKRYTEGREEEKKGINALKGAGVDFASLANDPEKLAKLIALLKG